MALLAAGWWEDIWIQRGSYLRAIEDVEER